MKMSFQVAAERSVEELEEIKQGEPWFEFGLADVDFIVREKPSPGQIAALLGGLADTGPALVRAVLHFLENIIEDRQGKLLRRMLEQKKFDFGVLWGGDELNPKGVVDTIVELASENPTGEPNGSSTQQPATGKRSTGRSPSKASTR